MIGLFSFFLLEIVSLHIINNQQDPTHAISNYFEQIKNKSFQTIVKDKKKYEILKNFLIYEADGEYCAWPSITKASNNDLLVMFSCRDEHISPIGSVVYVRSKNNGKTWSKVNTLYDSKISDGGGGFIKLSDGKIISQFGSVMQTKEHFISTYSKSYYPQTLKKWIDIVEEPEYKSRTDITGFWMRVSNDDGYSWSNPVRAPESVHGGIQLKDGSLLIASYWGCGGNITVSRKKMLEADWEIDTLKMPKFLNFSFSEPHVLQLPAGRLIMMIRTTENPYNDAGVRNLLWETYSDDNGKTWVEPFPTPLWGFPPHLLLLSDGRVLCTYGYRRPPFGQRACISSDGITWKIDDEIIIRSDGIHRDLGYPASIEIEPGKILTVYYQVNLQNVVQSLEPPHPDRKKPGILGTIWKIY